MVSHDSMKGRQWSSPLNTNRWNHRPSGGDIYMNTMEERTMKRIGRYTALVLIVCAFLWAGAGAAFAQGMGMGGTQASPGVGPGGMGQGMMGPNAVRGWFKSLNLTEDDLLRLEKVLEMKEVELVKAQNEITILQAQIANQLLDPNPDMKKIEEAVSRSLEWEKTVRLIQIERQIAIRRILGEDRWQSVLMLVREARASEKAGKFTYSFSAKGLSTVEADRYSRLLKILRRIM